MTSPKVTQPASRPRAAVPRHRSHSLAPEHLGEAGGGALLVVGIGGLVLVIAAIAVTVSGLGLAGDYSGVEPPPNLNQLGTPQIIGGIATLLLGVALVAGAGALLNGVRGSRLAVAGLSALTAILAVGGFVMLFGETRRDIVLLSALGVTALAFAGSAAVLARLRR